MAMHRRVCDALVGLSMLAVLASGCSDTARSDGSPGADGEDREATSASGHCEPGIEGLESATRAEDVEAGDSGVFWGEIASIEYAEAATGAPVFLNLGEDYPAADLSVAAFTNAAPEVVTWIRDSLMSGDWVCFSGAVTEYEGTPQIVVDSLSDLVLVHQGPASRARAAAAERAATRVARTARHFRQLERFCDATVNRMTRWSTPPTAKELHNAVTEPDWPNPENYRQDERLYRAASALSAYREDLEITAYVRMDPNLPAEALANLFGPMADTIENMRNACGDLR